MSREFFEYIAKTRAQYKYMFFPNLNSSRKDGNIHQNVQAQINCCYSNHFVNIYNSYNHNNFFYFANEISDNHRHTPIVIALHSQPDLLSFAVVLRWKCVADQ